MTDHDLPFGPDVPRPAWPARAMAALFRGWQLTFSAVLPPSCRYTPSCSHYGIEALYRHGLFGGLWLTMGRLLRCQPWGGSGHDPVPLEFHVLRKAPRSRRQTETGREKAE